MVTTAPSRAAFDELNDEIREHVRQGKTFRRPQRMRAALAAQRSPEWELEWLEAHVLFNCMQRAQPAKTHGWLGHIRRLRDKQGRPELFDDLWSKVQEILAPEFITPHGYSVTFAELEATDIFHTLGDALSPLSALGRETFLYAGALLGYVRDGKLIGHDDDIDVGIHLGECPHEEVAGRWLAYKMKLADAELIEPVIKASEDLTFKLKTDLPITVDLFPSWTTNGRFSIYPYSFEAIPETEIFPLKSFGNDPLKLPSNPEALLIASYGENWRIPDPLFHFHWPRAKRIFSFAFDFDYSIKD